MATPHSTDQHPHQQDSDTDLHGRAIGDLETALTATDVSNDSTSTEVVGVDVRSSIKPEDDHVTEEFDAQVEQMTEQTRKELEGFFELAFPLAVGRPTFGFCGVGTQCWSSNMSK